VVLSGVAADSENAIGVGEVIPVVGHCPATETLRQTGDSGGMSKTGLMFQIDDAQRAG